MWTSCKRLIAEGESAVPDVPLGEFSTRGRVDERKAILFLDVLEDAREDRFPDDWDGGPRRLVDGSGGHDEAQQYSERQSAMTAIAIILGLGPGRTPLS